MDFARTAFGSNSSQYDEAAFAQITALNRTGSFDQAEQIIEELAGSRPSKITPTGRDAMTLELAKAKLGQGDEKAAVELLSRILDQDMGSADTEQLVTIVEAANTLAKLELGRERLDAADRLRGVLATSPTVEAVLNRIETGSLFGQSGIEDAATTEARLMAQIMHFATIREVFNSFQKKPLSSRIRTNVGDQIRSRNAEHYAYYRLIVGLDLLSDQASAKSAYWSVYWFERFCWQVGLGASQLRDKVGSENPTYMDFASLVVTCRALLYGNHVIPDARRDQEAFTMARDLVTTSKARRRVAGANSLAGARFSRLLSSDSAFFHNLADLDWVSSAPGTIPEDAKREAFDALQEAMAGTTSQAFARSASRNFIETRAPILKDVVERRERLAAEWLTTKSRLSLQLLDTTPSGQASRSGLIARASEIERDLAAIDARLQAEAPEYFAFIQPQALSVETARELLKDDEAVLMIVPTTAGTHVMLVSREGLAWNRADIGAVEIQAAVSKLRADLDFESDPDGRRAATTFDRTTAFTLYQALIAPVASQLAGKTHLYIAADGSLATLPFSVLVTEPPSGEDSDPVALRATAWLADRFALVQLPSLQSLHSLRRFDKPVGAHEAFTGFGDPLLTGRGVRRGREPSAVALNASVFSDQTDQDGGRLADVSQLRRLARLPGTARELEGIRAALGQPRSTIHLRDAATETQVRSRDLSAYRILAFATHGLLAGEADGVGEPGLVLTPPAEASDLDDGLLTASEIATLKLNAEWVILSACNTAGPGKEDGEGLSGMARAFFYAGARSLLVSHWPVRDDVAPILTVAAIRSRHDDPTMTRARALQSAMRSVRNDLSDPSLAHPAAWASFVLVGEGSE